MKDNHSQYVPMRTPHLRNRVYGVRVAPATLAVQLTYFGNGEMRHEAMTFFMQKTGCSEGIPCDVCNACEAVQLIAFFKC